MVETGGIGIILRICAVGDHEDLHEFIQSAGCPEAVPLIAIDLVKRFPNGNAPALQLDMDEWQTVDQHRHIIAIVMSCPSSVEMAYWLMTCKLLLWMHFLSIS